ncbi:MAG TPA: SDR family oxidoreductase [Tepidisphaeraceae bacterium]|nr:SDR family oxidoreductase [Tepidisphaeraceae bacterium]
MPAQPLKDKSVVIVGGTTGLGYSAAQACVAAGARVVVVGRNPDNAKRAAECLGDGKAIAVAGDASDPDTSPAAIDFAMREFGRFDALYHVAGGSGRKAGDGPLHEITDEGWDYTHRLNLTSLFMSNRAAVRQFLKQGGGGSILNMGSVLGSSPSPRYFATHAYASAKSAVVGFTRAISAYYAQKGIRCNLIVPALVETPMSQRAAGDETILKFIATKQPLDGGRIGRPEDLDAAVVFFLSDASKFCTGAVLTIDGGWSVTEGQYDR